MVQDRPEAKAYQEPERILTKPCASLTHSGPLAAASITRSVVRAVRGCLGFKLHGSQWVLKCFMEALHPDGQPLESQNPVRKRGRRSSSFLMTERCSRLLSYCDYVLGQPPSPVPFLPGRRTGGRRVRRNDDGLTSC